MISPNYAFKLCMFCRDLFYQYNGAVELQDNHRTVLSNYLVKKQKVANKMIDRILAYTSFKYMVSLDFINRSRTKVFNLEDRAMVTIVEFDHPVAEDMIPKIYRAEDNKLEIIIPYNCIMSSEFRVYLFKLFCQIMCCAVDIREVTYHVDIPTYPSDNYELANQLILIDMYPILMIASTYSDEVINALNAEAFANLGANAIQCFIADTLRFNEIDINDSFISSVREYSYAMDRTEDYPFYCEDNYKALVVNEYQRINEQSMFAGLGNIDDDMLDNNNEEDVEVDLDMPEENVAEEEVADTEEDYGDEEVDL